MFITNDIQYVGVNDRKVDLFEGQYVVPNGMAYNSYVILDEKIAVMDTVDQNFTEEWLENLQTVLEGRKPDYLIVQHMEPDHSANIANFLREYPNAVVVSSAKAFTMMKGYFGEDYADRRIVVGEGDTLTLGKHVQRGGRPTVRDRVIATKLSNEAVHLLYKGIGNRVVGYKAGAVVNYDIFEALKMEKPFPVDTLRIAYETSN